MSGDLYEAEVVIDLKEAGLTHAAKKADKCDGQHKVPAAAVSIDLEAAGLVPVAEILDYERVFQLLHEQAHPDGPLYFEKCRERGCAEAAELP
jgi:hypothetical protein